MNTSERLQATQRAELEAMVGFIDKAIDGIEQFALLNLHGMSDASREVADDLRRAMSARDTQELFADGPQSLQRSNQRAADYAQRVGEIAAKAQAEFADAMKQSMALMQQLTREMTRQSAVQLQRQTPLALNADGATAWIDNASHLVHETLKTFGEAQRQAMQLAATALPKGGGDGAAKPAGRAARN